MALDEYLATNLANWNDRVPVHAMSSNYAIAELVDDAERISSVVRFDQPRMRDVTGKRLLHLQCHIGTDTVSWGKLGAKVTGVDFSGPALEVARDLAARIGLADARFVESTVDEAPTALAGEAYDIVYTGVGALCWLPDIRRWAEVVARLLAPGGRLFIREGHPVLWSLDHDRDDGQLIVSTPYFEHVDPMRWEEDGTCVDVPPGHRFSHTTTYEWNHGVGEVLTALLDEGLVLERFEEHRSVPWRPWDRFVPSEEHSDEWMLPEGQRDLVPLTYTLVARRPDDPPAE